MNVSSNFIANLDWTNWLRHSTIGYPLWQFWVDHPGDPRTINWVLSSNNPYPVLLIMLSYLYFVIKLGPSWMRNRKPLDLKYTMLFYNIFMSITNAFFVVHVVWKRNGIRRIFDCSVPNFQDQSDEAMWDLTVSWYYYISKYIDLMDTIFFVLRKKDRNLSFLHLYHHVSVPLMGYMAMRYIPAIGGGVLFLILNGSIHTIMYLYYALAALGPNFRKYLWWKPLITQFQLGQFAILGIYLGVMIFKQKIPRAVNAFFLIQVIMFFKMFFDFYRKSYLSKQDSGNLKKQS